MNPLLTRTLKHQHPDIEIPQGALFYPCCGHDLRKPIRLFVDSIDEFHFVDCEFIPGFERLRNNDDENLVSVKSGDAIILSENMIAHISDAVVTKRPVDDSIKDKLARLGYPDQWKHICCGWTPREHVQRWNVNTNPPKEIAIHRHFADGLSTFLRLDKISVFYLCRDNMGEGGSGQMWFQEKLLQLILETLVDGGLIVTDGSGRPDTEHPHCDDLPWSALWRHRRRSEVDKELPEDFACFDRQFKCIACCGQGYGPVYAWQVSAR